MSGARRKRRKDRLFRNHPFCWWCGCKLVDRPLERHETTPDNLATIDHLHSRLHPERGKHAGEVTTVLACHKCNGERGHEEQQQLGLSELHRRSGRRPFGVHRMKIDF